MNLLRTASGEYGWSVDRREVARIWKGGCIIRARLLDTLMRAFERAPELPNLLLDSEHLPRAIGLIEAFVQRHPKLPQVAYFDTAFPAPCRGSPGYKAKVERPAGSGLALSVIGMVFAATGHLRPVSGAITREVIDVPDMPDALRAAFRSKSDCMISDGSLTPTAHLSSAARTLKGNDAVNV